MHKSANLLTYNALIAECVHKGQGQDALNCYERMQQDGLSPNAVTFAWILKACGSMGAADKGEEVHNKIAKLGLLGNNVALGTCLVNMYCKCGALAKAHEVLEGFSAWNVISWTAMIIGYAEHGKGEQAINCFARMQQEGLSPNAVTFAGVLKACSSIEAVDKGEVIHVEIEKQQLLRDNVVLGNALVSMYAKCGALRKARQVLEEIPDRNVVSWTALIVGCNKHSQGEQALNCYEQMQHEGLSPNAVTFISILKACGHIKAAAKGELIHDKITKRGLLVGNAMLGTALVDMYAKCGALAKARRVFEELSVRNVFSWTALILGCTEYGESEQALDYFKGMQQEGISPDTVALICILKVCSSLKDLDTGVEIHDAVNRRGLLGNNIELGTALVDMYVKCGALPRARRVLQELPVRDAISWTALIAGYATFGEGEQALICLEQMQREGISPISATFVCLLKACGSIGVADKGAKFHEEIIKQGLLGNDIELGNALVDMYARCGDPGTAREVLEELPIHDVISWTSLIAGYTELGEGEEALACFEDMELEGHSPNAVTFVCILKACGSAGAADKGKRIHKQIAEQGLLENDVVLGNALVDMYARCRAPKKARRMLEELPMRSVIAWTSLIAGYIEHGENKQALTCFEEMQSEGLSPDAATFACVLGACSRLGLVQDAQIYFESMSTEYSLKPCLEHYTCMIDLFGRAGQLQKAVAICKSLQSFTIVIWSVLLGACQKWGDVEVGRWAFDHAIQVDKRDSEAYVLMANIYIAAGMLQDAVNIEAMRLVTKHKRN